MKPIAMILALCLCFVCLPMTVSAAPAEVSAKAAVLMDMTTGTVLYEQNAHERLPPASVTKVMTMLLVMEAIDSGKIGWEDPVTASEAAAAKGGSQIYLKVGETMTVTELLKSVAVSSANDSACALAEHLCGSEEAFVAQMNHRAEELGMQDTHFVNCTGLDDAPDAKAHLTSAYDIALMSRELMRNHPDIQNFTTIWMDTVRNGTFGLANTNKMVRFYPGTTGLKTGFTSAAGYCLSATATRDGLSLIAVVLGASTSQERFSACKSLLDYGFANYALISPALNDEHTVPVKLGVQQTVSVVPAEKIDLLIDKAQKNEVQITVTLDDTVTAPVSAGQRLGTLTVQVGEQVISQVPMVAESAVSRLSFFAIFCRVLQKLSMAQI